MSALPGGAGRESGGFKQGIEKGSEKGLRQALTKRFGRRRKRHLAEHEQAMLARRLDTLGADRLRDVVLDLSAEALKAWMDDPDAT